MRKIIYAACIATGLALAGCAQLQSIQQTVAGAITPRANPVTATDLYNIENAVTVAVAGLVAYRRACLRGQADANCRANIEKLQVYARQMPPLLKSLRAFVKNNDQVSAVTVYNSLRALVDDFKAQAVASGVA